MLQRCRCLTISKIIPLILAICIIGKLKCPPFSLCMSQQKLATSETNALKTHLSSSMRTLSMVIPFIFHLHWHIGVSKQNNELKHFAVAFVPSIRIKIVSVSWYSAFKFSGLLFLSCALVLYWTSIKCTWSIKMTIKLSPCILVVVECSHVWWCKC